MILRSLTRSEISSGHEANLNTKGEWTTRIEKWISERDGLKTSYIPIAGEKEYAPTGEEVVNTEREGRDTANRERDAACKVAPPLLIAGPLPIAPVRPRRSSNRSPRITS